MAKRKRLTPPQPDYLASDYLASEPAAPGLAVPEVKSAFPPLPSVSPGLAPGTAARAPIAQVAGDAAANMALREVSAELVAARREGRLIQRLPLDAIAADHLVRDRMAFDEAEMDGLRESIRARGQQTPVEVVDLGPRHAGAARYGLISGLRRLRALRSLAAEPAAALGGTDGEPRKFDTILAILRRPAAAADAYLAMVEENEIRVGLTYYERARIVARATALGVYPTPQAALRALFPTASRAKRSKIGSFIALHDALDAHLRFAHAIAERLGLALAAALARDATFAPRLIAALAAAPPATEAQELALLSRVLRPAPVAGMADTGVSVTDAGEHVAPGLWLALAQVSESGAGGLRLTLTGPGIDAAFPGRLIHWLKQGAPG